MDVSRRLQAAAQALDALGEALEHGLGETHWRDAGILRFVLAFEASWKAGRAHLLQVHGLDVASPKAVVRTSVRLRLLSVEAGEHALEMVEDRNLVVHTYDEALAEALAGRLAAYHRLMRDWLEAMREELARTAG